MSGFPLWQGRRDDILSVILSVCLSLGRGDDGCPQTYIGTFFFWTDIIGILSVPLDHSMVSDNIPQADRQTEHVHIFTYMLKQLSSYQTFLIASEVLGPYRELLETGGEEGSSKYGPNLM